MDKNWNFRSEEELKVLRDRVYTENPELRPITICELDLLGLDEKGFLYWEGKSIKTQRKLSLNLWQNLLAFIAALGAFISGLVSLFEYLGI